MINRKGVSDVVSTVLIILLVVAAVAIIAAVVINIVRQAPAQVNAAAECQKLAQDVTISCTKINAVPDDTATTTIDESRAGNSTVKITRGYQNQDVVFVSYDAIYSCPSGDNEKKTYDSEIVAGKNNVNGTSSSEDCVANSVYIIPKVKVGGVDTVCPAPTSSVNCN